MLAVSPDTLASVSAAGFKVPDADSPSLLDAGSMPFRAFTSLGVYPAQAQYGFYVPPTGLAPN